ncbi:glycosyltransferase [Patescibacteria group bacterium]|nr:glycosyltransferase [Patescibacteria group bacterium]
MIFLSIVIPAYNCQNTIIPLLSSIAVSKRVNFREIEVIVVDDGSKDETVAIISSIASRNGGFSEAHFGSLHASHPLFQLKIISLKKNQGPAHARNVGAKYAKGEVLIFFDSDVVVYKNTLFEVVRSFKSDPDLFALTGVWDKVQKSRDFFPKFKALRDWSYWINERDPRNYYYLFSTRVAAIRRGLFYRLGGFDDTYKAALVEDIELTYRIAKRHAVVFDPKVIVSHEFEDFATVAKKYFWRSYYWSKIYRERKRFDPVATTGKEALTTISAALLVMMGIFYLLVFIMNYKLIIMGKISFDSLILASLFFILLVHLWGVRKFLLFAAKEEGVVFAVKSFFTGIALYLMILSGAAASFLSNR